MMWAGSLESAYMVTVTFVFAEPGPLPECLDWHLGLLLASKKEEKKKKA